LDPSIGAVSGGKGKWTAAEDSRLHNAVRTHGGKDWAAIAALVPGRTKRACGARWNIQM
jgi:myb proto-oncogene protein